MVLIGQMKKYLAYAKIPRTIEIVEQVLDSNDCCVVFSDYTAVIDAVQSHINKKYANKFEYAKRDAMGNIVHRPIEVVAQTITGKDSSTKKFEKTEAFQRGEHRVLICNMKAGGVGLNMTMANKLIMNDLTWLPDDHFQAEDRIHRGGQTKKVEIIYLIAEGAEIDEKLGNVIETRSKQSAAIVDGGNRNARQASVMKGVMKYLEEVNTKIRKAGDFLVDQLDDMDFEDDFNEELFNDDIDFDMDPDTAQTPATQPIETTQTTEPLDDIDDLDDLDEIGGTEEEIPQAKRYPDYQLTILSREPLIYQYVKNFESNHYALAIQLRFMNGNLAFKVLKLDTYSGQLQELKYHRAAQVNGSFGKCDEVGTHIQQHLTKIDNYLQRGNHTNARATTTSLLNTLKKYQA
jgi:hypothetical protein